MELEVVAEEEEHTTKDNITIDHLILFYLVHYCMMINMIMYKNSGQLLWYP